MVIKVTSIGYKSLALKILLVIISILYISFLYIDFFNVRTFISSDVIKFIAIILCFFITLLTGEDSLNPRDLFLLKAGFFITILADLCLIIIDDFILGVSLFCMVQILYSIRYKVDEFHPILVRFMIVFLVVMVIYLIVNFFVIKIDVLFAVALFYSICLIDSVVRGIKACKNNLYPYPNKYMIAYGMILFLLCDINVGLFNINRFINVSGDFGKLLHNTSFLLIWIFYIPSQVLLSLSGCDFNKKRNLKI